MNEVLASFLAAKRAEQLEAKKKERNELLLKLGLVNSTREYAPDSVRTLYDANICGYKKIEDMDGRRRFYKEAATPIEISDEEYEELLLVLREDAPNPPAALKPAEAEKKPQEKAAEKKRFLFLAGEAGRSSAAMFFRVAAVIIWVAGLILAIASASARSGGFLAFITTLITMGISGAMVFFSAELYENVQIIADRIASARITEEP